MVNILTSIKINWYKLSNILIFNCNNICIVYFTKQTITVNNFGTASSILKKKTPLDQAQHHLFWEKSWKSQKNVFCSIVISFCKTKCIMKNKDFSSQKNLQFLTYLFNLFIKDQIFVIGKLKYPFKKNRVSKTKQQSV